MLIEEIEELFEVVLSTYFNFRVLGL